MKKTLLLALSASVGLPAAGPNSEPSVKWTIYAGYQPVTVGAVTVMQPCAPGGPGCISSAVAGDNNGDYIAGQNGVANCTIHTGGRNPTFDATLQITTPRAVSFNLGARVAYNSGTSQPPWATQLVTGQGFLNISHILYPMAAIGVNGENEYTTRMASALPDGSYGLRMNSAYPLPDAAAPGYYGTFNYNDPFQTALVRVHHCPDTTAGYSSEWCPAGHKESWYVFPDPGPQGTGTATTLTPTGLTPTQTAMLVRTTTKGNTTTTTAIGQYALPFFLKIELK